MEHQDGHTERTALQYNPRQTPSTIDFHSPIWNQAFTFGLAFITTAVMAFTIFFAYNCSLEHPVAPALIFSKPSTSILVLNIASQLTIFCLSEMTIWVFEALRWAFASSLSGIPAYTFLALSRATSTVGVLYLMVGRRNERGVRRDGHRLWGGQRILFLLMRGVLGILLLSDVSFKSTYPEVHSFPIQRAGLAPMNTSVINHDKFNLTATAEFWWYFPALTTDVKRVKAVTPLNCTNCDSYFIPGSMASIVLDPSQPIISQDDYPNALAYIQTDAPGYQIDFYPIDRVNDPYMTLDDCRVYGVDFLAIQICLKETNGSMLVAWSSCPGDVGGQHSCLNTSDWRILVPFNTKMTISQRTASTVFDRFNFTITDIINFSDATPTNYTANDFFTFYEIIFNVDQTRANWPQTTQYMFLLGIATFLGSPTPTQNGTGSDDRMSRLQEFLSTPIFLFNNAMYGGPTPALGKSVTLAVRSYRLVIAPYTIYSFFVGGFITLIWALIVLIVPMRVQTPNTSFYPETDIASKIGTDDRFELTPSMDRPQTITQLLWPLSNSHSPAIKRRLRGFRFFARMSDNEYDGNRRVELMLEDNGMALTRGMKTKRIRPMSTAYRTEQLRDDSPAFLSTRYM